MNDVSETHTLLLDTTQHQCRSTQIKQIVYLCIHSHTYRTESWCSLGRRGSRRLADPPSWERWPSHNTSQSALEYHTPGTQTHTNLPMMILCVCVGLCDVVLMVCLTRAAVSLRWRARWWRMSLWRTMSKKSRPSITYPTLLRMLLKELKTHKHIYADVRFLVCTTYTI